MTPKAWEAVQALAVDLPDVTTAGFECRLNDDPQVDVAIRLDKTGFEFAERLGENPIWRSVARVGAAWRDPGSCLDEGVRDMWLEFDLDRPGCPVPGVFLTLIQHQPANIGALVEAAAQAFGGSLPPGVHDKLPATIAALPAVGRIMRLGVMFGRGGGATRVEMKMPGYLAPAFLERVGWRDPSGQLPGLLERLWSMLDNVTLDLDVSETVHPRLGIECMVHTSPQQKARWRTFLDYVVQEGLCRPEKAEALLAWPGGARLPREPEPESFWPVGSTAGEFEELCLRRISHVKFAYEGRLAGAKAYFGFLRTRRNTSVADPRGE